MSWADDPETVRNDVERLVAMAAGMRELDVIIVDVNGPHAGSFDPPERPLFGLFGDEEGLKRMQKQRPDELLEDLRREADEREFARKSGPLNRHERRAQAALDRRK